VSCAKTAEPVDLPFGFWTWVGPRKDKFNRIRQVTPMCRHGRHIGAIWQIQLNRLCGGDAALCQITFTTGYYWANRVVSSVGQFGALVSPTKMDEPMEMPFGLRTRLGPGNHVFDGDQIPHGNGLPIVKYRDTLRSFVQKRLNRSRCPLSNCLKWSRGIMNKMGSIDPPLEGAVLGKMAPFL